MISYHPEAPSPDMRPCGSHLACLILELPTQTHVSVAVKGRWASLGTGSHLSDPEPPVLRAGKSAKLEDKMSKLGS